MPGLLLHSPSDIIRQLLVDRGLGAYPPADPWPIYVVMEPDGPDDVITLSDMDGTDSGRTMNDGERQEHHGVMVRVRAFTHTDGYAKIRHIAVILDQEVYDAIVVIGVRTYKIHSVSRLGDVMVLGKETLVSKRSIFTVNTVVSVRMVS